MSDPYAELEAYLAEQAKSRLADYLAFLRIPSISTLPEHVPDMRHAATFLAERMRRIGLEHVEISETGGHPVVYGDWLRAPGAPIVLVYGHYDVQPVDPLDEWAKPPFDPRVEAGRVFARGAADDKGQVHLHLAAVEALLAVRGTLPLNLKYLFEGEEEHGSAHLDAWLEANRARLASDLVVISDTGFFDGNLPQITIGLRGLMFLQVDVAGPRLDLHSGQFGGTVRNPGNALAQIIAGLHDEQGRVAVAGFYDAVRPLDAEERAASARLPFDEAAYAVETGVQAFPGETGYTIVERRGARPTLDVNGLWGGFQGEGSKTIIPAHAHAKISTRLVADMDPQRTFERVRDRVMQLAPPGVNVDVQLINLGMWSLMGTDHQAVAVASAVLEDVFGRAPVFLRSGGSIPAAASFASLLRV
ncbi:MAG: dipeptidase, partial [Candidatus Limnocylindrales bacterium]